MKRTAILITLFIGIGVFAQSENLKMNSIRLNTLGLFTGYYEFQYERVISEKTSSAFSYSPNSIYGTIIAAPAVGSTLSS